MEKYFVNYEQSLALKELGFDMPCFAYVYTGDTGNNVDRYEETEPSRAINFNHDSLCISQPIKSQVFEWFREKYKISGEPTTYYRGDKAGYGWAIGGQTVPNYYSVLDISSYEEAETKCIDKLIEIVKNK